MACHYWNLRLYRVPKKLGKGFAECYTRQRTPGIPPFRQTEICREPFVGHSATSLPSVFMALGKGLNSVKKQLTENENEGNQSVCQVSQMFYRVLHFLAEINKKTPPAALMAGARRACGRGGAQDDGRVYLSLSSCSSHQYTRTHQPASF